MHLLYYCKTWACAKEEIVFAKKSALEEDQERNKDEVARYGEKWHGLNNIVNDDIFDRR